MSKGKKELEENVWEMFRRFGVQACDDNTTELLNGLSKTPVVVLRAMGMAMVNARSEIQDVERGGRKT